MKYFFDNNLSPHLAKAVFALSKPSGHHVIHKKEKFPHNTKDIVWIGALAKEENWVVISHDHFAKGSLEKEALRESGLITFVLKSGWSNLKGWDKAWKLIRWWPRIIEQSERIQGEQLFGCLFNFRAKENLNNSNFKIENF